MTVEPLTAVELLTCESIVSNSRAPGAPGAPVLAERLREVRESLPHIADHHHSTGDPK